MKSFIQKVIFSFALINQSYSTEYLIANPTYDLTFKDLFGPNGMVIDGIGGKERMISFLNDIYTDEHIFDIEYMDITSETPLTKKIIFDILCKCYNFEGVNIYDVEIQRKRYPDFVNRTVLYGARLLSDNSEAGESYSDLPQVRILSLLNYVFDSSKPGIFQGQIIDPKSGEQLSKLISWTYIQLPILFKEGTDNKWLQILSAGSVKGEFVQINPTEFNDNVYKSGISLLNSYTTPLKSQQLKSESRAISDDKRRESSIRREALEEGREEGREEGEQIGINRNRANLILNLKVKNTYSNEQISELLDIHIDLVNLVIAIADLSQSYLDYCNENYLEPDYGTFLEEARKQFNIPDESIEIVEQARDNVANS